MKPLDFDPHKSFISLTSFKIVFFSAIFLSGIIAITIFANSNISSDWSYKGFNGALNIFKVPLGILAVMIPVIALLAANHRSEQSREQMRLAREQNNFSNYYKHLEEFEKHTEKESSKHGYTVRKARALHKKTFPRALHGEYDISPESISLLSKLVVSFCSAYRKKTESEGIGIYESDIINLRDIVIESIEFFCIGDENGRRINTEKPENIKTDAHEMVMTSYNLINTIRAILEFAENYVEPITFKHMPERHYMASSIIELREVSEVATKIFEELTSNKK